MKEVFCCLGLLTASVVGGCAVDGSREAPVGTREGTLELGDGGLDTPSTARAALSLACEPASLDRDRSLVVHDRATLSAGDFSLRRTLDAILRTGRAPRGATAVSLLRSLLDTYNVSHMVQPVKGLAMPVDVRPGEAELDPRALLDPRNPNHMVPVALFNRLDLAPASAKTCGEHRIVYAKLGDTSGRFFLIFEAALPNPRPNAGIEGCRPVANFWGNLSDAARFPTARSRAAALERFFYNGVSGFKPVVHHDHYGVPFGQVRSNHFIDFRKWQLREWRTQTGNRGPRFVATTVKQSPLAEFFDSNFEPPLNSVMDRSLFRRERRLFQRNFLRRQMSLLAAPELSGAARTEADVVNGIHSAFAARHNEFQSDASGAGDDPTLRSLGGFRRTVHQRAPAGLTGRQMMNRAGAMTCGGCHQFSSGRNIGQLDGQPVFWPRSSGFVHVDEFGQLSPALTDFFLPARQASLSQFLCTEAPRPAPSNLCQTDADCSQGRRCEHFCLGSNCARSGVCVGLVLPPRLKTLRSVPTSREVSTAPTLTPREVERARAKEQAEVSAFTGQLRPAH